MTAPMPDTAHCCACIRVCHHIGGPWYCALHTNAPHWIPGPVDPLAPFAPPSYPPAIPPFTPSPAPTPTGWSCPTCHTVWAPHVDRCATCSGRGHAYTTTRTVISGNQPDGSYTGTQSPGTDTDSGPDARGRHARPVDN